MDYLQLHTHVSYGLVDGQAVFLDLRRDRYMALDPHAEEAFREARTTDEPVSAESVTGRLLLKTGLFRDAASPASLAPAGVTVPAASLFDGPLENRCSWIAALQTWRSVGRVRRRLAGKTLFDIVDALRDTRPGNPIAGDARALEDVARAYRAARALVPVKRRCLLDALALLDRLGDHAARARLVFGVRMNPFGAHCWLQTDCVVLTDARDTIGAFVPVLAV